MALLALSPASLADRASGQFSVSATVVSACSGVSAIRASDGQSVVVIDCSQASPHIVNLSRGNAASRNNAVRASTIAGDAVREGGIPSTRRLPAEVRFDRATVSVDF